MSIERALTLRSKIQNRRNLKARAIDTHMLFAVLTAFYWCEIIGDHQLALFRNLRARSKLIIGNKEKKGYIFPMCFVGTQSTFFTWLVCTIYYFTKNVDGQRCLWASLINGVVSLTKLVLIFYKKICTLRGHILIARFARKFKHV